MAKQWGLVLELDNIILNNYWRKFFTYKQIGWDEDSIHEYLSKKGNIMQVASFNTPRVSFSASSRRNRFYNIYNQVEMLDQDVPYKDSVESLKKITEMYEIFVVSSRSKELEAKTREVLTRLGYPMKKMTFFFKKATAKLYNYRKKCFEKIVQEYPTGVGICLSPSEAQLVKRYNYTPIGFTSIKNTEDFNGHIQIITHNWKQICSSLNCA